MTDFTLDTTGRLSNLFFLTPNTETAEEWLEENVGVDNGYQPRWPTALIEGRYLMDVVEGIVAEGFTIEEGS